MAKQKLIIAAVFLFSSMPVKADLFDRGNGLIYDDEQDITWVQIADLAAGSSFDDGGGTFGDPSTDGLLTWASAEAFVDNLVYAGFDDWRLPTMDVNNDSIVVNCALVSQAECLDNELAYLYFYGLGGVGGPVTGDTAPFTGILFRYWGSDEVAQSSAWTFDFVGGIQGPVDKNGDALGNPAGAWAVRSGDVSDPGDLVDKGTYVSDTSTGLDWLKLTETNGLSYNNVIAQLGSGGQWEGWRHATGTEAESLLAKIGFSIELYGGPLANAPTGYFASLQRLNSLLGDIFVTFFYATTGAWGVVATPSQPGLHAYVGAYYNSLQDFANFTVAGGGFQSDDTGRLGTGHFLVRDTTPEERDTDADGVDDEFDLCPDTLVGARVDANGCAINEAVNLVVADIFTLIDSQVTDKGRDKLFKAQDKLTDALTELAQGDVKKGLKKIADSVKKLLEAAEEGVDVADLVDQLIEAARSQAQAEIDEAIAVGGDSEEIAKAQEEMVKADEELAKGKPDKAVDKYAKAWDDAEKAQS